ncbi:hypothetical protein IAT38_007585 [Cryptococcus sp. DSM 104549]
MFALSLLLTTALASTSVHGAALPVPRGNYPVPTNITDPAPSLAHIACVEDNTVPSLVSSNGTEAESRESCAEACLQESKGYSVSYFIASQHQCFCADAGEYPSAGQVVYAVDQVGNCRSEDDASVEYFASTYELSHCYYTLSSPSAPSRNFTAPSPLTCLDACETNTVSIRPEYADGKNEYECACWDEEVTGGQGADCGFGVEAVYTKA